MKPTAPQRALRLDEAMPALRDVLAEALAAYLDSLEKYTLQDLLEPRKELGRLLLLEDSAGARA